MNRLDLPPQLFVILAGLVEERVGLHYGPEDREIFAGKVKARAIEAGFDSLMDYYYFLRYDDADRTEFQALVNALAVHETYLFREPDSLHALLLQLDRGDPGARRRIWSAACATGEEPLTLAMLLEHRKRRHAFQIVASDVSERALELARAGRLSPRAIRGTTLGVDVGRWVHPEGAGYRVEPDLIETIEWRQVNLLDRDAVSEMGVFDGIVCRNVLIYFSDDTARRVVENLCRVLRPGGYLVVGASESLLRLGTGLQLEERSGAFLYRKPATS